MPPHHQVRAAFTDTTVRVYQAYSHAIADAALAAQTFVAPFKRGRMTWIKPSFTWTMFRSGFASKPDQERVLAIDITRAGLEGALAQACLSHFDPTMHESPEEWRALLAASPVRIQWDPERSPSLEVLPYRALQVGLEGASVDAYLDEWITRIEDATPLAHALHDAVKARDGRRARELAPVELPYPLPDAIARRIGVTSA